MVKMVFTWAFVMVLIIVGNAIGNDKSSYPWDSTPEQDQLELVQANDAKREDQPMVGQGKTSRPNTSSHVPDPDRENVRNNLKIFSGEIPSTSAPVFQQKQNIAPLYEALRKYIGTLRVIYLPYFPLRDVAIANTKLRENETGDTSHELKVGEVGKRDTESLGFTTPNSDNETTKGNETKAQAESMPEFEIIQPNWAVMEGETNQSGGSNATEVNITVIPVSFVNPIFKPVDLVEGDSDYNGGKMFRRNFRKKHHRLHHSNFRTLANHKLRHRGHHHHHKAVFQGETESTPTDQAWKKIGA